MKCDQGSNEIPPTLKYKKKKEEERYNNNGDSYDWRILQQTLMWYHHLYS